MGTKTGIKVYGISFESVAQLLKLLGIKGKMSLRLISSQYGSIEDLVKTRLHAITDKDAKERLELLLNQQKCNLSLDTELTAQNFSISSFSDKTIALLLKDAVEDYVCSDSADHKIQIILEKTNDQRDVVTLKKELLNAVSNMLT